VNSSDIVFKYLILVNIQQRRYRDNPSMLGSCGILAFSLFGLSGFASFSLMMATSLAAMLMGAILWLQVHQPLDDYSLSLGRAGATLIVITVLALLSVFPRWWGLTLVLDALILLVIGVIFTEFSMGSQKKG
jgi:glucan phosphoethanolaminetransferase (alkaline phosphatase superfamily)